MAAIPAEIVAIATDYSLEDDSTSHFLTLRVAGKFFIKAVVSVDAIAQLQSLGQGRAPTEPAAAPTDFVFDGEKLTPMTEESQPSRLIQDFRLTPSDPAISYTTSQGGADPPRAASPSKEVAPTDEDGVMAL